METSTETTDTGLSFAYDASGLRTEKTVVTKTYEMVHTHAYTATVIEPTCTEGGYTLYECDCGDSYQDNETDPLGHDYVESGVDTYTHSYTATVVEPTCTERGYTLYECACGHSYQSNFTDALGHDYIKFKEQFYNVYYRCTRCGDVRVDEIIPLPTDPTKPPIAVAGLTPETETNGSQRVLVSTVTEEHSYIYASGMLLRETITSGSTTRTLDFRYDNVGYPYALIYNNGSTTATYYYITNLQGDVMYLVDSNGNQVAAYTYDPYGKILSATGAMAEINPLRYRGYYYDAETGFYYLQSRYYDPNTCRFINADGYASTGQGLIGYNMFAYCNNNPISFYDPSGRFVLTAIIIGVAAGALIGGTANGIAAYNSAKSSGSEGDDLLWATVEGVGKGAVIGGVAGGLIGATGGVGIAYGWNTVAGTAMLTGTATIAAKTTEVAALQLRKSASEGENGWQITNDCFDAVFNNGFKIIMPAVTKAGTTIAGYLAKNIIKYKTIQISISSYLTTWKGGVISHVFSAYAWANTIYSAFFSDDPVSRANDRGYTLK